MATTTLNNAGSTSKTATLTGYNGFNYNKKSSIKQAVAAQPVFALPTTEILHYAGTGIWSYDVTTQVIHLCKIRLRF